MKLYGYFRSSAAYRVRIALNYKGVSVQHAFRHLRHGQQAAPDYLTVNAQGLVPALVLDDGTVLTQSVPIIEYLEETYPEPALLPDDPVRRAKVRAFAAVIACDIHPVQNLRVLNRVKQLSGEDAAKEWAAAVNREGLAACEALLVEEPDPFCFGSAPSLADLCLVPQLANARRFGVDLASYPRLLAAESATRSVRAFVDAAPERQPDAE